MQRNPARTTTPSTLSRRSALLACGAALASGLLAPAQAAGQWPEKMIKMVVAFPPGGPTDTAARLVAQSLSERFGQNVIIENRAGASGSVGTSIFIKSPADGYNLSMFGMPALLAPVLSRTTCTTCARSFPAHCHGRMTCPWPSSSTRASCRT